MCDKEFIKNYAPMAMFIPASVIFMENKVNKTKYETLIKTYETFSKDLKKKEVLDLRRKGYSNVEISQTLKIPYSEVKEL